MSVKTKKKIKQEFFIDYLLIAFKENNSLKKT